MAAARRIAAPLLSQQLSKTTLRCSTVARNLFPRAAARAQPLQRAVFQPTTTAVRWHSAPANTSKQYEFAQIREMSEQPSKERILIDVREPNEYTAGAIPSSLNIPVKSSPDALFLPAEEFEDKFGFEKPSPEKEVVFYCRSGVRSSAAAELARQGGYEKVGEYRGSWLDWEKNMTGKG